MLVVLGEDEVGDLEIREEEEAKLEAKRVCVWNDGLFIAGIEREYCLNSKLAMFDFEVVYRVEVAKLLRWV